MRPKAILILEKVHSTYLTLHELINKNVMILNVIVQLSSKLKNKRVITRKRKFFTFFCWQLLTEFSKIIKKPTVLSSLKPIFYFTNSSLQSKQQQQYQA